MVNSVTLGLDSQPYIDALARVQVCIDKSMRVHDYLELMGFGKDGFGAKSVEITPIRFGGSVAATNAELRPSVWLLGHIEIIEQMVLEEADLAAGLGADLV